MLGPAPPPPRPLRLKGGPDEPEGEGLVYYRVRAVGPEGREGPPTLWTGVDPKLKESGLAAYFEPHVKQGGLAAWMAMARWYFEWQPGGPGM
jgi:hypothetical protein